MRADTELRSAEDVKLMDKLLPPPWTPQEARPSSCNATSKATILKLKCFEQCGRNGVALTF